MQKVSGVLPLPFMDLGAKSMVTGYDHNLFLFGVIFFFKMKDRGSRSSASIKQTMAGGHDWPPPHRLAMSTLALSKQ